LFSVLVELGIDSYGSQNNLYDEWIEYKPLNFTNFTPSTIFLTIQFAFIKQYFIRTDPLHKFLQGNREPWEK
jgi:hypothetical protein